MLHELGGAAMMIVAMVDFVHTLCSTLTPMMYKLRNAAFVECGSSDLFEMFEMFVKWLELCCLHVKYGTR